MEPVAGALVLKDFAPLFRNSTRSAYSDKKNTATCFQAIREEIP
jgi:hypothetical protein